MSVEASVPTFLYIGTSKAGSTWLFNALAIHPEVYLTPAKGLYYFDHHFDKGQSWYLSQFAGARDKAVAGEISHSYLSSPPAALRIAELNPAMQLLACLREPVDRAFSDYLDLVKNSQYEGPFEAALEDVPRLIDRGRYATHLQRYLEIFPRHQFHIGLFDDLRSDAQGYADDVFSFLEVAPLRLPSAALRSRMPAGMPRSATLSSRAKAASRFAERAGFSRLRSRVKRSVRVRQLLYRPFYADRPTIDPAVAADLRREFTPEVHALDTLLGRPFSQWWGYDPGGADDRTAAEVDRD